MKTKANILEELVEKHELPFQYVDDILFYAPKDRDIYDLFMRWCESTDDSIKEELMCSIYEHIEQYR